MVIRGVLFGFSGKPPRAVPGEAGPTLPGGLLPVPDLVGRTA
ncbi:hypothetical protein ACGRHY_02725 [Streptomyces sp. HK10]